jgi:hypothetical protein
VYQRLLVNTYHTSDLCRPRARARPLGNSYERRAERLAFALTRSGAGVDLPGFGRGRSDMSDTRMTLRLLVVLAAVARPALLTVRMTSIVPGVNPIFRQMMQFLNVAV